MSDELQSFLERIPVIHTITIQAVILFFECVKSNADLWDIHKGSYQRSCRQGKTSKASESTDIIHAWIRKIFLSVPGLTREPLVKDGLGLADLSYGRERDSGVRVYYSKRLKRALESGKWSLKLPHTVLHRCNSEEHGLYGDVHVLTSSERPGQFKVGATTIPLDKRVYIYQRRYFTKISVYENFFCKDPFGIEKNFMDYSQNRGTLLKPLVLCCAP